MRICPQVKPIRRFVLICCFVTLCYVGILFSSFFKYPSESLPDKPVRYSAKIVKLLDNSFQQSKTGPTIPDKHVRDSEKMLKLRDNSLQQSKTGPTISDKPVRDSEKMLKLLDNSLQQSKTRPTIPDKPFRDSEKIAKLLDNSLPQSKTRQTKPVPDSRNKKTIPVGYSEKKSKSIHGSHNTSELKVESLPCAKTKTPSCRWKKMKTTKKHLGESDKYNSGNAPDKTDRHGGDSRYNLMTSSPPSSPGAMDNLTLCLRPDHKDGVQDIFCVKKPAYLEKVKNPCWYDESQHVRCLPYFHLLGCAKCSSTDLYSRLCIHPHIVKNTGLFGKEALWWSWSKYGIMGMTKKAITHLPHYVNFFEPLASKIEKSLNSSSTDHTRLITGDASPPDFWDFRGWPLLPQNHGLNEPEVLTPHLMKHLYRNPKFILLLRNPTDRLYSDFFFTRGGLTAQSFHDAVESAMAVLDKCRSRYPTRRCFYSSHVYRRLKTRIHYGCYSVFLKEWLDVFPLRHFLFLRTEDYNTNITSNLQTIYSFLELEPLPKEKLLTAEGRAAVRVNRVRVKAGPMMEKTRTLLDTFYKPFNQELAAMLNETRYLWT